VTAGAAVTPDANGVGLETALEGYASWTKAKLLPGCKNSNRNSHNTKLIIVSQIASLMDILRLTLLHAWTVTTSTTKFTQIELSETQPICSGTGCSATSLLATGKSTLFEQ
jgi:hypothetical protein